MVTSPWPARKMSESASPLAADERHAELLEVLDAAVGDVHHRGEARAPEKRGGERAPVAGRAGDCERRVPRKVAGRAGAELVVGDVHRARDVAVLPLVV